MKRDLSGISKTIFMDLAFTLIAALVLLVNEPIEQAIQQREETEQTLREQLLVDMDLPFVQREVYESKALDGESLYLCVTSSKGLQELSSDGSQKTIPLSTLYGRLKKMKKAPRVVVLAVENDVPYSAYSAVRDILQLALENKTISRCIEVEKTESEM